MVLAKSKNTVGLGNSLIQDRFGLGRGSGGKKGTTGIVRTGPRGEAYITNAPTEAGWVKMRSITEQAPLDEFLSTAELAGTDFTAEKLNNIKIIHPDQRNPYLLSADEERLVVSKHAAHREKLTVPRRPPWHERMTKDQLDTNEKAAFVDWRRGLAELQEANDLLITPFERNLEVWRQLWRVVERSDLVVQIVDARNPLLFRSDDLERYVKEVDTRKESLLLVNKADLLTLGQRRAWADYFRGHGIAYRFFSAFPDRIEANAMSEEASPAEAPNVETTGGLTESIRRLELPADDDGDDTPSAEVDASSEDNEGIEILSPEGLEGLFMKYAPEAEDEDQPRKIEVGLVGYPNVGKSSTINALIGTKKVSVSATPGKTKHFQTIHLSPSVVLCDCPGLVFPSFATTKAELVCNGILPIDQLREFTGPTTLVCQRIPRPFLEATYGIRIHVRPLEEGGTGTPTAEELLVAYAVARGYTKTGQGQPDESRAARYILKDYVNGKLRFCHPPPTVPPLDPIQFNSDLYSPGAFMATRPGKRPPAAGRGGSSAALAHGTANELSFGDAPFYPATLASQPPPVQSDKSLKLDRKFFAAERGGSGHVTMPFNYKYTEQGSAELSTRKQLSGRKQREMVALASGVDPSEVGVLGGKKHFKGNKRRVKALGED